MARIIYGKNKIPTNTKKRIIKNSLLFKLNLIILLQLLLISFLVLKFLGKI